MKSKSYLLQQTHNRLLDQIKTLINSQNTYLPSDLSLSSQLEVSRTTVRNAMQLLAEKGLIIKDNEGKRMLRKPQRSDYYDIGNEPSSKEEVIKNHFLALLNKGELMPGCRFSELELARQSGCNTVTVREFLVRFSRFGLIEKQPRSQWKMVQFDSDFAKELIEFRKILEMRSLVKLLGLAKEHTTWIELRDILNAHQAVEQNFDQRYLEIPSLDARLHLAIHQGADNRFINQFFEVVAFVCHYHYQWQKTGEKQRLRVAMEEHINLLIALLARDSAAAINALEVHLNTAERTLLECSTQLDDKLANS